ncbi:MAG: integrin alpha, partial [Planctomycetota bacterium]
MRQLVKIAGLLAALISLNVFAMAQDSLIIGHTFEGEFAWDYIGRSVAGVGDINQDGHDDVVISAPGADHNGILQSGSVFVYSGKDYSIIYAFHGDKQEELFGGFQQVGGAGDVNGDGYPDIII